MFNGIADVLADVVRNDFTSMAASSWVAAYPTIFTGGASSVPEYLYMSMKDIWAPDVSITEWQTKWVTSIFGLGYSGSKTVDVIQYRTLDQVDFPKNFPQSNLEGGDGAEVHIYFKLPDNVSLNQSSRTAQAAMRIRKLLDHNWRTNVDRQPQIPSTNTMIRNDQSIKAYWQGALTVDDIKSVRVIFYVFYTNLVLPPPTT